MEITALLSAVLAYGRVGQIAKSLITLFDIMGKSPANFTLDFSEKDKLRLAGFKHRFNTGQDITEVLLILKKVLKKFGSLEKFFLFGYDPLAMNIIPAVSHFTTQLLNLSSNPNNKAIKYLLTNPADRSCCKRMFLFLRWMVRDDEVDTGLWKSIDKTKLIMPVDTHIGRLSKIIGLHNNKTISIKTAIKITEGFRTISPADPVKYDFALSRIGILENCTGQKNSYCPDCGLLSYCGFVKSTKVSKPCRY